MNLISVLWKTYPVDLHKKEHVSKFILVWRYRNKGTVTIHYNEQTSALCFTPHTHACIPWSKGELLFVYSPMIRRRDQYVEVRAAVTPMGFWHDKPHLTFKRVSEEVEEKTTIEFFILLLSFIQRSLYFPDSVWKLNPLEDVWTNELNLND